MTYLQNHVFLRKLTQREMAVLRLVFSGQTSKQIAKYFDISYRTVEVHRANILHKLGVSTMAQLSEAILRSQQDMEELLQKNELHLQEAQRIAHLGSWSWDVATNANTWSDEQFRMLGYAPGGAKPSYELFFQHIHPDDHALVKAAIDACLRGEAEYTPEFRIIRTDGGVRHIQAGGSVERDATGKPVSMTGTILDITDIRQAQTAMRANEQKFTSVFNASPVAIGITRLSDQRIIDANEALLEFYGYTREEVIGRTALELGLWAHPEVRQTELAQFMDRQSLPSMDILCKTKSGEERRAIASARLIEVAGEPCAIGFLTIRQD